MRYRIFSDNAVEGRWFRALSGVLSDAEICKIGPRGTNPRYIERLIEYDRPDIILVNSGGPLLVLEKTREVPTGHNVGQRFARLVRAAEDGIPVIKFFPFDAMKHGEYAATCNLNIRLLRAFERMTEIHDVPVLAVNWPCDEYSELVDDGSENRTVSELVDDFLRTGHDIHCATFTRQLLTMRTEYEKRLAVFPKYEFPPPSVTIAKTTEVLDGYTIARRELASLLSREESVVYEMGMTSAKCKRQDPYTGTQFIYDYIWCREGPKPENKHRNLILRFPRLTKAVWETSNPNDPTTKSCNWYITANALVFADAMQVLRA